MKTCNYIVGSYAYYLSMFALRQQKKKSINYKILIMIGFVSIMIAGITLTIDVCCDWSFKYTIEKYIYI